MSLAMSLVKAFTICAAAFVCIQELDAQSSSSSSNSLSLAVFISAINGTGSIVAGSDVGRPFVVAVDLAVELINQDPDLIPGYTLEARYSDSQCTAGPSVRGFIDQIMDKVNIMIIGADCSTSSEPIAELAPFWNLVQISPLSSSPALSRNETYTTFLRMVSSDAAAAEGVATLMLRFNWTRVAALSQQENIFASIFAQLREELTSASITNDPHEFNFNTNEDPTNAVYRLSNSSSRIVLLNTYPSYAREILCTAFRLGLTQRNGYMWLLHAWYPPNWWQGEAIPRSEYTPEICSVEEMEEMVEYAILVDHFASVDEDDRQEPTNSSLTPEEFEEEIRERLGPENSFVTTLAAQANFYFDAVWTAGLALHNVIVSGGYDLTKFNYHPTDNVSVDISRAIYDAARSLQFIGTTGPVRFNPAGDRFPTLRFFQYRRDEGNISRHLIEAFNGTTIFPFGIPQDEKFVYVSIPLFGIYTILACVGVVIALLCLGLNLYFRDKRVIKLSSPYLNILIVSGMVLFYVDVILFGIDEGTACRGAVDALCMIRLWIASISFSLVFGTIFAKTWRVYYVFYSSNRHKRNKKTIIQDWVLFMVVGVLVVVDVVFMICITAFPSARLTLKNVEFQSNSQALSQVVGLCRAEDRIIWLSVLFVYKGALLIVGSFLAFEIRKVKIRHLNDSKLIGMSVYGILVLSVALAAMGLLLEGYVDVFYAVVGLMVMVGNTSLLGLIFIPKFYSLWKDPEGLSLMVSASGGPGSAENTSISGTGSINKDTVVQLKQEIKKLRLKLDQKTSSLHSAGEITEDSMKPIRCDDGDSSTLPKPRSERAVSFTELGSTCPSTNNTDLMEATIIFARCEDDDQL